MAASRRVEFRDLASERDVVAHDARFGGSVFIGRCSQCSFVVPVKVSKVVLDECREVRVAIAGVLAAVEVVHSTGVVVTSSQPLPLATVDMSADTTIRVPGEGSDALRIVASSATGVRVQVEGEGGDVVVDAVAPDAQGPDPSGTVDPNTPNAQLKIWVENGDVRSEEVNRRDKVPAPL